MGQLVAVTEKPSSTRGIVRFETNRSLSGMGHEHFASVADAWNNTPSDELARRMFATGQVAGVHIYGSMITVDLHKGYDSTGLADIVRDLYKYWHPGVEPPSFEDLQPAEDTAASASTDAGGGGGAELSEAAKRVPSHLLERGRLGRQRWTAKQS